MQNSSISSLDDYPWKPQKLAATYSIFQLQKKNNFEFLTLKINGTHEN